MLSDVIELAAVSIADSMNKKEVTGVQVDGVGARWSLG